MRKGAKREEIFKSAMRLFVEKGFEKTTIRDIAREAGINSSSIYYYFKDKEAVLYEILIDIMDESLEKLREIEKSEMSLKDKIHAIIKLHTKIYGTDPVRMELIVHNQKSISPEHWDELRSKQKEYVAIVAKTLSEMRNKGQIRDLNTMACTFALFGMIQMSYSWYNPDGKVKPSELSDLFMKIFTKGIFLD